MWNIAHADYILAITIMHFFKITNVKLELLSNIYMLLKVEKVITERICHANYQYAKDMNKYMKDYDKNKKPSYLEY